MTLTLSAVRSRLADIEELVADGEEPEAATEETDLWHDVLTAIANGADDPAALAKEALLSLDIDFDRV